MLTRKQKFCAFSVISLSRYDFHITNKFTIWYGNSSFDITEKYIAIDTHIKIYA